jgi:hypothetical protein
MNPIKKTPRKNCNLSLRLCVSATTVTLCFTALAQYAINWSTIDGGGGTSTGGVFTIHGTIGQPDAGSTMSAGQFSVTGGFWALPMAVQTPGAPLLSIVAAGVGQATISWEPDPGGYVLQETMSLAPTNWVDSASGSNNPTDIVLTNAAKFYRLRKP